ncbi:hypothetical protein [Leptospira stimsonii]|uniref:Uncharacterized protein n=1 Tax=Leptospira stimsonii TaxID=2202203 RepID=A0A396Z9B9_9LEPT|nr:hypothetical protein [Leptospira stimsonii]RHX92029.1 hypothetical protein DLM75_02030 [Leptospira stimsonii]
MLAQTNKEADWETFIEYSKRFSRFTHEEVRSLEVKIDKLNFMIEISETSEYVRILIERYFRNSIWEIRQGDGYVINI